MEFPITKNRLKKFRENEAATVLARLRVEAVVNDICAEVERTALTTGLFRLVYQMSRFHTIYMESKSIYPTLCHLGSGDWSDPKTGISGKLPPVPLYPIINTVLEDLVILFPDSKISVDPLETYILIDWS